MICILKYLNKQWIVSLIIFFMIFNNNTLIILDFNYLHQINQYIIFLIYKCYIIKFIKVLLHINIIIFLNWYIYNLIKFLNNLNTK